MGFQGDVAGIGLGELLQGLARGGREGVLTLRGGGLGARLGLQGGQIFLLPEADEDPEIWRKRCERAWVKDPNQRIDVLRMSEIAYAARLEGMFRLLDCQGVHFRFEPGPLPQPGQAENARDPNTEVQLARMDTGAPKVEMKVPVHCPGVSVEYLLLEYARLSDETQPQEGDFVLTDHCVPRLLTQAPSPEFERLWGECDGMSNLIEIADRMGWPIRQCRASIQDMMRHGYSRPADAHEMLLLAQHELSDNRFARAASRLAGWTRSADPGPPSQEDAQLLLVEWQRAKLPVSLAHMTAGEARTLLRRLELAEGHVESAIERWKELRKYHRHDPLTEVRLLKWQLRSEDESEAPSASDILNSARKFQDLGLNLRAGVMLRAAASRMPETTSVRLELGTRMLAVGLVEEGAPWLIEACRSMLSANLPEKAVPPLRAVLSADPSNRAARNLLAMARKHSAKGKATRRNTVVALASVLVLALGAVVKVRWDQAYDRRLAEVTDRIDKPELALKMLETSFSSDSSDRVANLRSSLTDRLRTADLQLKNAWLERFREAQMEVNHGDIQLGLKQALELPSPPQLTYLEVKDWPRLPQILEQLAARLEQTVAEWGAPDEDRSDAVHVEQRLERLIDRVSEQVVDHQPEGEVIVFRERLQLLAGQLSDRAEVRAQASAQRQTKERLEQQDMLLAAARAHAQAGDLERSVQSYHRLVGMEDSEAVKRVLQPEIRAVEVHLEAVKDARGLADRGEHVRALARLNDSCPNPSEHLLPMQVESQPSGARARFADGSSRVTPFLMEAAAGERIELALELDGHEPQVLRIERPGNRKVLLSRLPERWWRSKSRVEAMPVSVEEEHIVSNRAGQVARLGSTLEPVWQHQLESLGGIARTPVFLPRRQGFLLFVTEDGAAWLLEAGSGKLEGPWNVGAPPVWGPNPTATGVVAAFVDGRRATWEGRLKPDVADSMPGPGGSRGGAEVHDSGTTAGLAVLRNSAEGGAVLESPWSPWAVSVEDGVFRAAPTAGNDAPAFTVSRKGEWVFMAWEAPHSKIPKGRLWISDGAGLRSFIP